MSANITYDPFGYAHDTKPPTNGKTFEDAFGPILLDHPNVAIRWRLGEGLRIRNIHGRTVSVPAFKTPADWGGVLKDGRAFLIECKWASKARAMGARVRQHQRDALIISAMSGASSWLVIGFGDRQQVWAVHGSALANTSNSLTLKEVEEHGTLIGTPTDFSVARLF